LTSSTKPVIIVKTTSTTNNGEIMTTATLDKKTAERQLTVQDRCDAACDAQAYVKVVGSVGDLLFCSHHYTKIMKDANGYLAMSTFATETIDERQYLSDKRAGL
jgi:hypothetical protein